MKKLYAICSLLLITASLTAGTVKYTYRFSDPSVKQIENFQAVTFKDLMLTGLTGEPALPYEAIRLLLPPGEEAVSVNYDFEEESALDGNFLIYPQQPSQPYSIGSDDIFHQNEEVYASAEAYPVKAWGKFTTQFLNGHSFLLASFTPVKYIPAEGKISFFRKVTVTIETKPTGRAATAFMNLNTSPLVQKRINGFAQNPTAVSSYPVKSTRDGEYQILIVTPEQFMESFQQLVDLYLVRGLKTQIVSTESIDTEGTGQDLQEKIRNYIIDEYQAHGIEYVLLGGDVEHVPYRGFYCKVYSSSVYEDSDIPADLYYSALDGNWNTDGDGYWGEPGEDDLLPDVAVARFPVSTSTQLQRLLHKTVTYQDQPVLGEIRNILMAGEELWTNPDTYGEDYLELLIGYHEDNGYTTDGLYDDMDFTKLYDSQEGWSGSDLMYELNQGKSFVHHSGHANETYVMRLNIGDIINPNFAQVNGVDHNYTIIYTHGCLCGAFDMNDCIGEAMVLISNLAVAGGFNSRYGWFNEGQTEGPSAHLHREFVDALYHDMESHIGAAHMISKIATAPWVTAPGQWEEGALRWCFYDCNIFGDPALSVWTDEPYDVVTDYPGEILPGTTTVPVDVTVNGQPAAGMMCVIMGDGEMMGCSTTDSTGHAEISIPGGFEDVADAELVVSGYDCLPAYHTLNIEVGLDESNTAEASLTVMPNPFNDHVKLGFDLGDNCPVTIRFYEVSGKLLDEMMIEGKRGYNEVMINTSEWPEGIILTRIIEGNKIFHDRMIRIAK